MADGVSSRQSSAARTQLVIVENDHAAAARVQGFLEQEGYGVAVARDVVEMRAVVARGPVDIVIMDAVLSEADDESAAGWLQMSPLPVILLIGAAPAAAPASEPLRSAEPLDLPELLARLQTVECRLEPASDQLPAGFVAAIERAGWTLDADRQLLLTRTGAAMNLTQAEYRILMRLARYPRQVVSREALLGVISGRAWEAFDRSVDVHISNLRRKIDPDPQLPSLIRTVRGAGYMFVPETGSSQRPEQA
jgi:two-component system OmpR family response regulator